MSTNGLVPFDYDDPRRPRPYLQDDEDGLLGGMEVPRGTSVPQPNDSGNIQPNASANPRQGGQPPVLDMQGQPAQAEAANVPPVSFGGHEATPSGGAGSEAAAAEVGGLGPLPGTYVAPPENGRPTLGMIPQKQENMAALAAPTPSQVRQPNAIENMQSASDRLSGMPRRPATMADVPKDQQHHGWRKAADIAAAIGIGAFTANPLAGANVYNHMHSAPLRRAQETYDSGAAKATGDYDRSKQIQAANVGEERVHGLEEKNRIQEERNQAYSDKMENTFVAGTEQPDTTSPTGFSAQTVSGKMKPFTPKQDRAISYDAKVGGFMMNGSRYVPKTIEEGASLEAGLSTQFPELKNGPYSQRWKEEKKNQTPQTHIHNPSAEETRYNDWKAAFARDNGREPTAEEIRTQKAMPKFDVNKERSDATFRWNEDKDKEQKRFMAEWDKAYKDNDGKPDNATLEGLKTQHASIISDLDSTYKASLKFLDAGQKPPAAAAAAPAQQAQPAAAAPAEAVPMAVPPGVDSEGHPLAGIEQPAAPVRTAPPPQQQKPSPGTPAPPQAQPAAQGGKPEPGTMVNVGGQFHMVKGYNAQTGKPIVSREIYDPKTKQPVTQAQK